MRDLNYFISEAANSTQTEFELNFADVIEVFDTNETTITTQCGRTLVIHWYSNGDYQNYKVLYETQLMEDHQKVIEDVILKLRQIYVDGETMQYILNKVGLEEQMLRQLVMSATMENVFCLVEEKNML